jgi:NhaA family Na+:H+ antiporter
MGRTSVSQLPNHHQAGTIRALSPLRDFLRTEASGATLLAFGAISALIWANSPWSGSYESFWHSRIAIEVAGYSLDLDLRHWVNDGLITIFFLVVGLEIKRELTQGHLANRRSALLPGIAALGGMAIPAVIYLLIAGSEAPRGWAIPVATDIALAVGVLSVVGARVPASLRAFLLGLAIVDDIGAILIIATVYSTGVTFGWLSASMVGVLFTVLIRRLGAQSVLVYVLVGCVVWLGLFEGGVHPTIAGVGMGLLAPIRPRNQVDLYDAEELGEIEEKISELEASAIQRNSVSVVEWLQHLLHPWTSFVIVPIFALANSGIEISSDSFSDALGSPVTWGVFFGLLAGKPLGIFLATYLAIRVGISDTPKDSTNRQIFGAGTAAGIGFTVAIFITELALPEVTDQVHAKLAILFASVAAALLSLVLLMCRSSGRRLRD